MTNRKPATAKLGGADHVLDEVGVELECSGLEADEDLVPLVEGVAEAWAMSLPGRCRWCSVWTKWWRGFRC
jgi:hypothetical protein